MVAGFVWYASFLRRCMQRFLCMYELLLLLNFVLMGARFFVLVGLLVTCLMTYNIIGEDGASK